VLPGARKFADYGAVSAGTEMDDVEQIMVSARSVNLNPEDERAALEAELDGPGALTYRLTRTE